MKPRGMSQNGVREFHHFIIGMIFEGYTDFTDLAGEGDINVYFIIMTIMTYQSNFTW